MDGLEHIEVCVELLGVLQTAIDYRSTFPSVLAFSEAWVDDEASDVDRISFRSLAQVANHSLVVDDCQCLLVLLDGRSVSVSIA